MRRIFSRPGTGDLDSKRRICSVVGPTWDAFGDSIGGISLSKRLLNRTGSRTSLCYTGTNTFRRLRRYRTLCRLRTGFRAVFFKQSWVYNRPGWILHCGLQCTTLESAVDAVLITSGTAIEAPIGSPLTEGLTPVAATIQLIGCLIETKLIRAKSLRLDTSGLVMVLVAGLLTGRSLKGARPSGSAEVSGQAGAFEPLPTEECVPGEIIASSIGSTDTGEGSEPARSLRSTKVE